MAAHESAPDGGRQMYSTPDYSGLQFDDTRREAPAPAPAPAAYPPSGLELDNRATYPEAVYKADPYEKFPTAQHAGVYHVAPPYQPSPDAHGLQVLPAGGLAPQPPAPKGRSKKFWILIGTGAVVLIAVVVGCVVGLVVVPNNNKKAESDGTSQGSNTPGSTGGGSPGGGSSTNSGSGVARRSVCRGTLCPQILSVIQVDKRAMIFGRGMDNDVWYNTASTDAISTWPEGQQWESLKGGPFSSQPSAMTWPVNDTLRVSVTAVADPGGNALMRQFSAQTSQWDATWQNQFGRFTSPISLCVVEDRRLDGWAIQGGLVLHNYYLKDKNNFFSPVDNQGWQDPVGIGESGIVAQPGITCRYSSNVHDVFVYSGKTGELKHTAFGKSGWIPLFTYDGGPEEGFQGSPTVLATGDKRTDFFGIGKDGAMYHGYFSDDDGHPRLTNLGGSFQSVPAAVRTASGRVDVVALGTTDTLMHRALVGGQWSAEWEDLGVFGNSAPAVANFTTTPETVGVYVMGTDGQVNQTVWTVGSGLSWKGLKWQSMGGNLTTSYLRS